MQKSAISDVTPFPIFPLNGHAAHKDTVLEKPPPSKRSRLTEADQVKYIVDLLLPYCRLQGKRVAVSLPAIDDIHYLKRSGYKLDIIRSWLNDQFREVHGFSPNLQVYKSAYDKIVVMLKQMSKYDHVDCNGDTIDVGMESTFREYHRVDGQDSLCIFTLPDDRRVIGKLGKKYNKETDEEYEVMNILWGSDVFPTVHRVLVAHDASEGQQTLYDVAIAGIRKVLPMESFKSGNWYDSFPGVTGVLDSSKEKLYKAVIMQVAKAAPKIAAFETTGWHKITTPDGEEWIYLLPDGRFLVRSGVDSHQFEVILTRELLSEQEKKLWATFNTHPSAPSVQEQQAAYTYLLHLTKHGQALMLFAHNVASLLYEFSSATFSPSYSAYLLGEHGSGKTSLAGFDRCLLAPYALKAEGDASFLDTVTMVEMRLTYRASMPVIADDVKNDKTLDIELAHKIDALTRATFNRTPVKRRATQKMTERRPNYIRTLPVITAEYIPHAIPKSFYRRVLILELAEGELLKDDGMQRYAPVLQYWGLKLIQMFQQKIAQYGYDRVVSRLEQMYRELRLRLREKVIAKWKQEQPNCQLPGDWDSIADSAAYLLLYFDIFRFEVAGEIESSSYDLEPCVVDTVYRQILRMEGRLADEEGLQVFEKAILSFFEDVRAGKIENGQRWRVDHKVSALGKVEPPQIGYAQGSQKFPSEFWGWTPEMIEPSDSQRPRESFPVAYIDESTIYLTERARKELLKIIQKLSGGEGITSEKALGDLAEKEGWIIRTQRGDIGRRALKIVPPQGPTRVWALALEKFLAHFQDTEEPVVECPDNVSDFLEKATGPQLEPVETPDKPMTYAICPICAKVRNIWSPEKGTYVCGTDHTTPDPDPVPPKGLQHEEQADVIQEHDTTIELSDSKNGVLTDTHLYRYINGKIIKTPCDGNAPHDVSDILQVALNYNLRTVWVLAGTELSRRATPDFIVVSGDWQFKGNPQMTKGTKKHIPHCKFVAGYQEGQRTAYVGFLEYNDDWEMRDVGDPVVALAALSYLEDALGVAAVYSAGKAGVYLMEKVNRKKRVDWIQKIDIRRITPLREKCVCVGDLNWKRELSLEDTGYLVSYDKNMAYPASCTSVLLGTGEPAYSKSPQFDRKKVKPGIWHCKISGTSEFDGITLPHPTDGKTEGWFYTYTVKLLLEVGYHVEITDAWVWNEYHTILRPYAEKLFEGREVLDDNLSPDIERYKNTAARAIASKCIKFIAVKSLGWTRMTKELNEDAEEELDWYIRPDWDDLVIDHARYHMFWRMRTCMKSGYYPVGVHADCLYFAAPTPDHEQALANMEKPMMERCKKLGGYKQHYKTAIMMEEARPIFARNKYMSDVNTELIDIDRKHLEGME